MFKIAESVVGTDWEVAATKLFKAKESLDLSAVKGGLDDPLVWEVEGELLRGPTANYDEKMYSIVVRCHKFLSSEIREAIQYTLDLV